MKRHSPIINISTVHYIYNGVYSTNFVLKYGTAVRISNYTTSRALKPVQFSNSISLLVRRPISVSEGNVKINTYYSLQSEMPDNKLLHTETSSVKCSEMVRARNGTIQIITAKRS